MLNIRQYSEKKLMGTWMIQSHRSFLFFNVIESNLVWPALHANRKYFSFFSFLEEVYDIPKYFWGIRN